MKVWIIRLAVLLATALAVLGLWSAASSDPPRSLTGQAREVELTLKCPTCLGESVADSTAPVAEAMRLVIADQLAEGRSPEQIRSWFSERYGDVVLLDPPLRGVGWALWSIPLAMIGVAALVLARRRGKRARWCAVAASTIVALAIVASWHTMSEDPPATIAEQPESFNPVGVLEHAAAANSGDVELRLALGRALDEAGRTTDAVEHYAAATRLRPFDADIGYLYASALVRSGSSELAMSVLDETLLAQPDHASALLLQGTMAWQAGQERGATLLRRFLELVPDHLAAPDVRALLAADPEGDATLGILGPEATPPPADPAEDATE